MKLTLGKVAVTVAATGLRLPAGAWYAQASTLAPYTAPPCHASVSNAAPKDYSTVVVYVNTSPGPSTRVTTAAHFKTVTTTHTTTDPKVPAGHKQPDAHVS